MPCLRSLVLISALGVVLSASAGCTYVLADPPPPTDRFVTKLYGTWKLDVDRSLLTLRRVGPNQITNEREERVWRETLETPDQPLPQYKFLTGGRGAVLSKTSTGTIEVPFSWQINGTIVGVDFDDAELPNQLCVIEDGGQTLVLALPEGMLAYVLGERL